VKCGFGVLREVCDQAKPQHHRLMAIFPNQVPEPKLFSLSGRETPSSFPVERSSAAASREADTAVPPRYVLPQDLNTALKQLSDADLDRLVMAALEERTQRKRPPLPEQGHRKRNDEAVEASLPLGKLNAIRAAFKAGLTPTRIAREFGVSRQDVQRALASDAKSQRA
jgi:hypothetical protein